MSGKVSIYQKGFTLLIDQAEGNYKDHVFVQYASSFNPASGYAPNSGSLVWADGSITKVPASGINQPTSIKQVGGHTWYITSLGDGSVLKVTYE